MDIGKRHRAIGKRRWWNFADIIGSGLHVVKLCRRPGIRVLSNSARRCYYLRHVNIGCNDADTVATMVEGVPAHSMAYWRHFSADYLTTLDGMNHFDLAELAGQIAG